MIFPIAFAVGIVDGLLPALIPYFSVRNLPLPVAVLYESYLNLLRGILTPIILFAVSYLVGRGVDVNGEIKSTILSTYLGCLIGDYFGLQLGSDVMSLLTHPDQQIYLLYNALIIVLSVFYVVNMFFVSFSGIAIASIMKSRKKTTSDLKEPVTKPET